MSSISEDIESIGIKLGKLIDEKLGNLPIISGLKKDYDMIREGKNPLPQTFLGVLIRDLKYLLFSSLLVGIGFWWLGGFIWYPLVYLMYIPIIIVVLPISAIFIKIILLLLKLDLSITDSMKFITIVILTAIYLHSIPTAILSASVIGYLGMAFLGLPLTLLGLFMGHVHALRILFPKEKEIHKKAGILVGVELLIALLAAIAIYIAYLVMYLGVIVTTMTHSTD